MFRKFVFKEETLSMANIYAAIRMDESVGFKNAHGLVVTTEQDERIQLIGVLGEWAVANYLGMEYNFTVNTFKAPDLYLPDGRGVQVKASEQAHRLVIRSDAKNYEPYVLVKVSLFSALNFAVGTPLGWITPYEARLLADVCPEFWQDPGNRNSPAIFIPANLLRPVETLETHTGLTGVV